MDPHNTPQHQQADHGLHSSTTTAMPSLQPSHHHRPPPTSSAIQHYHQHLPQPGYPTVPVSSMAGHSTQLHYQGYTQPHWYGSGVQRTNVVVSPPPFCGNSSTSASSISASSTSAYPRNSQQRHSYASAHAPAQNSSISVAPSFPTAPSQRPNAYDGSAQGQGQYHYHSGPAAHPQLVQMQPYQRQPYTSPTHATPAGALSLIDDPSSHTPSYIGQTNLIASSETPNSGAAPGGSNARIVGTSTRTMGESTSFNEYVGPSRSGRTNRRQVLKPYQRPTPAARKPRPITFEGDLLQLQQRCRRQGADEGAIELLGKAFANEVSLEALTRPLTDAEVETKEFGVEAGRVYIAFLETTDEEEGVEPRYVCRLCHSERTWKNCKDALRHLRRDHFGLADVCDQWYVFGRSLMLVRVDMFPWRCSGKKFYTKGEMTRHPCK
jgi:hypothetical protein